MQFSKALFFSLCIITAGALAAVPVEDLGSEREKSVIRGQHRAAQAYRDWEEARYQLKLADQDAMNAEEAYRLADGDKAERKQQLDAAKKALAVARSKETAARQAYDKAVLDVDRARN